MLIIHRNGTGGTVGSLWTDAILDSLRPSRSIDLSNLPTVNMRRFTSAILDNFLGEASGVSGTYPINVSERLEGPKTVNVSERLEGPKEPSRGKELTERKKSILAKVFRSKR